MRILFTAGRELEYTRNQVVLRALRRFAEVEVIGYERRASISWRSGQLLARLVPRLLSRRFDLVYVGFYGHLLAVALRAATHQPLLFDAFISTYDTLCFDRRLFAPDSLPGRLAFHLDQLACRQADHVLLDTQHQVDYFQQTFDLSRQRLSALPVGCSEDIFFPQQAKDAECPEILYYATYQPLHGMEVVVRAAARLTHRPRIRFQMIGGGPGAARIQSLAQQLDADNIRFTPAVPLQQLPQEIASAMICLGGHFGASQKAGRVIPGKIYQILAMGQPVIAADTPANRELLQHEETAYLCPPDDVDALADAILTLYQSPTLRQRLGANGRAHYLECCSEAVITSQLHALAAHMAA